MPAGRPLLPQVSGYVREICQQMTQTVPKAVVTCMVVQVRGTGGRGTGGRREAGQHGAAQRNGGVLQGATTC